MENLSIRPLQSTDIEHIVPLTQQLNPDMDSSLLKERHLAMFEFSHYHCFGLFLEEELIGLASAWLFVKLYSGQQVELDNVIIDQTYQSKGFGAYFINALEAWAKEQGCQTVELNTYAQNTASHKFYYRHGYVIKGYHFLKRIKD